MAIENENAKRTKHLNIWKINPSFKDIQSKNSMVSILSVGFLSFLFMISTFIFTSNVITSIGIGIFTIVLFMLAFSDEFFYLRNIFSFGTQKFNTINPFKNLIFWYLDKDPSILLYSNKQDLVTVGSRIFKIEVIPDNVHPNLNQFIGSLAKLRIPYSYQVIQTPIVNHKLDSSSIYSKHLNINSLNSFQTTIYFSVHYYVKGVLNETKIRLMQDRLNAFTSSLKANFIANFMHFKIKLLSDDELLKAIRIFTLNSDFDEEINEIDEKKDNYEALSIIIKIIFLSFVLIYLSIILFQLIYNFSLILIIDVTVGLFFISSYWKELFFEFTKKNFLKNNKISVLRPFTGIKFYMFRRIKDSVFLHINNTMLVDIKILNLRNASYIKHNQPQKFFRSIVSHKIPFTYSSILSPLNYAQFEKVGLDYMKDKAKKKLLKESKTELERENWILWRKGIWRTILNISVASYKFIPFLKMKYILELENETAQKFQLLKDSYQMNHPNYSLAALDGKKLISGLTSILLKNKFFRLNGTHLNYVLFQGQILKQIIRIEDEFKKGIETKVAAEFNSPLQLENFVNIGHTINTECLENEIQTGFTFEQLKNLLITNGTQENREDLSMKIVSELVKVNIPSIIFDFSGNWSKLLNIFNETRYTNEFLYFKLGSAFNIDLLQSGIPFDKNNLEYLNYAFDVYAMIFKKDDRTMEVLKNTILTNPEMDLSTISFDVQNKQNWEKNSASDSIVALFNDFSQQTVTFLHTPEKQEHQITVKDFLDNDKTVIIDLSILKDLKLQVFSAFILLSKIIHFIDNSDEYYEKMLVLPSADLFFDNFYLERNMNYWKIDKFLEPLKKKNFGLIFSINQIHYLHSNIFNYFRNFIAFKTTDIRDISVIKNQINLDEIKGKGYYSSKRNSTYQIDYLMTMKPDEIIIKRSDINQPFPGIVDNSEIKQTFLMSYEEIIEYMDKQGFNLKFTEQKLLEQTKKTLFEKDFGKYSIFLEDVMKFLNALKTVDKIGNLYQTKIKEELKKTIYPRASKITKDKKKLMKIRDELFDILLKQGYLVENHPKKASGSESIRTSYSIGPQYQKATDDFFNTKRSSLTNVSIDILENASGKSNTLEEIFQKKSEKELLDDIEFRETLMKETGAFLLYNLYKMNSYMNNQNYQKAVNIGRDFVKKFLIKLYKRFFEHNTEKIITEKEINASVEYLADNQKIPFSKDELKELLTQSNLNPESEENIQSKIRDLYNLLSNFSLKIQKQIIEG